MSNSEPISIQSLTKTYSSGWFGSKIKAVDNLSLTVEQGKVVGLIGPNGAGKSTTIYCLLGMLLPDDGNISIFGHNPQLKAARAKLGFQSENFHTYQFLKPKATLRFYGRLASMDEKNLEIQIHRQLQRLGLEHATGQKVKSFSKGMKQRLGLAQALLHDPDLLILDEPFTGLDPEGRKVIADIMLEEKSKGKTIFFSSHILSDIERLCDEVVMIRKGQKVLSGALDEVTSLRGKWAIKVENWERLPEGTLDPAWDLSVNQDGLTTEIICSDEIKDDLLRRLLESSVRVVDVQQKKQTLEDLYMNIEQNQQARV